MKKLFLGDSGVVSPLDAHPPFYFRAVWGSRRGSRDSGKVRVCPPSGGVAGEVENGVGSAVRLLDSNADPFIRC